MTFFGESPHAAAAEEIAYTLFAHLSPQQRREVERLLRPLQARAGETVVHKGEPGDALYLVAAGEVEVLSEDGGFRLTTLHAGQDFGSVALLSGAPRSASVRAVTDVELRILSIADLRALSDDSTDSAYVALLRNLLVDQGQELRRSSDDLVESLRRQVADMRKRLAMGSFIGAVIFIMCLYGFFLRDTVVMVGARPGGSTPISVLILLGYLVTLYALIRRSGLPLSTYGLTTAGWRRSIIESLLASIAFLALCLLIKSIALRMVPAWQGLPLFQPRDFGTSHALMYAGLYLFFAPAQEFIARGVLQSSLQEFLDGRWVTARAIVYSTLMFSATHLHVSTQLALLVSLPSVLWGVLYARHRTLIGVSVSHVLIGGLMFFLVGIPT